MEIRESFFKGLNRAISRDEFFDPDFFYTLQNARLFQNGRIGEIIRIKGFQKITNELDDLDKLYDIITTNIPNHIVVFYKTNTTDTYSIKVFDDNGTLIDSFSFIDQLDTDKGRLKQHENSVFIAPFNKILYETEGEYFLEDFISSPTKIIDITTDTPSVDKAKLVVQFNETLSNFQGLPSRGFIIVKRNTIPSGVSDTIQVQIGSDISGDIEVDSSMSPLTIARLITEEINDNPTFSDWTAVRIGFLVQVIANTNDPNLNNQEIRILGSKGYIRSSDNETFSSSDDPTLKDPLSHTRGESIVDYVEGLSTTIETVDTFGGFSTLTIAGTIEIVLKDAIVSKPIIITGSDTTTDIASKALNILENTDEIRDKYNISQLNNEITLEAKEEGKKFTTDFILNINTEGRTSIELPDGFYEITERVEGADAHSDGTLEENTKYWYTARFRYLDGHLTSTCSPRLMDSGANRHINIEFDVDVEDLNGELPKIQIFRKQEGGEFFLIRELNLNNVSTNINDPIHINNGVLSFLDTGFSIIQPLDESAHIWTANHNTQEVIENRLVKANLRFFNEEYNVPENTFNISTFTNEDTLDVAPINSKLEVSVRPQFKDGTLGYFTEIDRVNINEKEQNIQIQQNEVLSGTEKEIDELRFYGRYLPFGEEQNLKFNTVEIQTPNLRTIEDPNLFPSQTKVFFGYKHIFVINRVTSGGNIDPNVREAYVRIGDWSVDLEDNYRFIGRVSQNINRTIRGGVWERPDEKLEVNIHGTIMTYIPITTDNTNLNVTIYKLESYEALKEAISTGELYIRINRANRSGLSSTISDDDLINLKVRVTGLDDKTNGSDSAEFRREIVFEYIEPPRDTRLYLVLEQSSLDEIDNQDVNYFEFRNKRSSRRGEIELQLNKAGSVAFDIINFQKVEEAEFDYNDTIEVIDEGDFPTYEILNITNAKYNLINRNLRFEDNVIYLGKKTNEQSTIIADTTGFTFKLRSNLFYSRLAQYNIYETPIKESDFNFSRTLYPNQLVWSNPLLEGNYFSGGRNFSVTNFFNVPSENGEILDIKSLGINLYVFCERGVARLLIGETLTQQRSGQVFVDSSQFITKSIWILENLPNIKPESIVKKDGAIYFTDGNDVYQISQDSIENISQGFLNLNQENEYSGSLVKKYDEYRLSDTTTGETFVYNTKYNVWYGPNTYIPQKTVEVNNKIISFIEGLCEEDVNNTFNGSPYVTLIESVGNDTEVGSIDKTYRKFYIDIEGSDNSDFKYGKDYEEMVNKSFNDTIVKNGRYHVGVKNTEGNTKKIYWNIETTNEDFSLKGISTLYTLRRRR